MAKKRPSDDALEAMLREGHFGVSDDPRGNTPLTATAMVVSIDAIDTYDRNPRRERNPVYEEIKASIRASGLQQPLVVTRRPGEEHRFVVKAGGNTRLAVLRELHAETGDARFGDVHCLFEPWTSESAVLVAHLVENDTRGELTFIDKARAIRELRTLIETESGETLTQEALARALRARGYRLERSMLSRMDYALDTLAPHIPQALGAGMGQPQIQRIRQLERAGAEIWDARGVGARAEFAAVFTTLLARYDGVEWQLDRLRRALENELAERTGDELRRISLDLDAVIRGRPHGEGLQALGGEPASGTGSPVPLPDAGPAEARVAAGASGPGASEPMTAQASETPTPAQTPSPLAPPAPSQPPAPTASPGNDAPDSGPSPGSSAPDLRADTGAPARAPDDLESLRTRTAAMAADIATVHELGDIVEPIAGRGAGFLVDFVFTGAADDDDTKLARATLWWFLATVSEQFHASPRAVEAALPAGWRERPIGEAIVERPGARHADLLTEYTLVGFGPLMGPLLVARLRERDWEALVELLRAYRALRHAFDEAGRPLWPDPP